MKNVTKKIVLPLLIALIIISGFASVRTANAADAVGTVAGIGKVINAGVNAGVAYATGGDPAKAVAEAIASDSNFITAGIKAAFGAGVSFISYALTYLFSSVVASLTELIGFLINKGIEWNIGITTDAAVKLGWPIVRDIANLGFVIGILFIAFATMIRSERYGAKKLLGTFIIVALLVNYSLVIPGVILDASHVFASFFIQEATGNGSLHLSDSMMSIVAPQRLTDVTNIEGTTLIGATNDLGTTLLTLVNLSLVLIFGILILFVLGATAFMVVIRYFILLFLLIVAPIAWLALIFPGLSSQWTKWWNAFLRWTIFLPSSTFFIYMAVKVLGPAKETATKSIQIAGTLANSATLSLASEGTQASFIRIILSAGLLIGGLIVSEKFGITGAAAAVGMVKGAKDRTLGAMKGAAKGAVVGTGAYVGTRPAKAGVRWLANTLNNPVLRGIPGVKGAITKLNAAGSRKGDVDEAYKNHYGNLSAEQMKVVAGTLPLGPVEKAAMLRRLIELRMVGDLTKGMPDFEKGERLKKFVEAEKDTNPGTKPEFIPDIKAMADANPDLAPDFIDPSDTLKEKAKEEMWDAARLRAEHVAEVVAKIRADKAADIAASSLLKRDVALALNGGQIGAIYRSGSVQQVTNLENSVKGALEKTNLIETRNQISDFENQLARAEKTGATKEEKAAIKNKLKELYANEDNALISADIPTQKAYNQWKIIQQQVGRDFEPKRPLVTGYKKMTREEQKTYAASQEEAVLFEAAQKRQGEEEIKNRENAEEEERLRTFMGGGSAPTKPADAGTAGVSAEEGAAEEDVRRLSGLGRGIALAPKPAPEILDAMKKATEEADARKTLGAKILGKNRPDDGTPPTTPPTPPDDGGPSGGTPTPAKPKPTTPVTGGGTSTTTVTPAQNSPPLDRRAGEQAIIDDVRKDYEKQKDLDEAKALTAEIEKQNAARAEGDKSQRERIEAEINATQKIADIKAKTTKEEVAGVKKVAEAQKAAGISPEQLERERKTAEEAQRKQAEFAQKQREADEELGEALTRKRAGINAATEELKKSVISPAQKPAAPQSAAIPRPFTIPRPKPQSGQENIKARKQESIPPTTQEKPRGAPGAGPDIGGAGTSGLGELNR